MITVKDGGIKQLQVQDNGCGIEKKDLDLLCERHATSKLREYDDLSSIQTLGFRGEALASISYISHLSVVTMTGKDEATTGHGWKASYKDGLLLKDSLRPAPGTRGTTLLAEDLFYNAPLRRKSLRNASDEYSALLEVVQRYAVYHAGVAMSVKKAGEAKPDLSTLIGASREEAIKVVYGIEVAKHLCPIKITENDALHTLQCSVQGFVTSAEYTSGRKIKFILFINGRSVDFLPLKRSLEALYATLLPKSSKPFIFLDVTLPPSHVDVNIHPTKKEVAFLHQEELVGAISEAVQNVLVSSDTQRTYKQAILPIDAFGVAEPKPSQRADRPAPQTENAGVGSKRPDKMVRTDAREQTMHVYHKPLAANYPTATTTTTAATTSNPNTSTKTADASVPTALTIAPPPFQRRKSAALSSGNDFLPTAMEISSLVKERFTTDFEDTVCDGKNLPGEPIVGNNVVRSSPAMGDQLEIDKATCPQEYAAIRNHFLAELSESTKVLHEGLMEMLRSQKYVGMVDSCRSLIQAGTRLYLLDLSTLTRDMFYQQALRRCTACCNSSGILAGKDLGLTALTPPPSVKQLTLVALEAEEASGRWEDTEEGGTKEEVADLLSQLLVQKSNFLLELFGIHVDPDGCLLALPRLIDHYLPNPEALPSFVLGLGQRVEWGNSVQCASDVAALLAELYHVHADDDLDKDCYLPENRKQGDRVNMKEHQKRLEWEVEHVVLPALRLFLKPSNERANDGSVVELTRLERLYRVFERC